MEKTDLLKCLKI